ncbi:hypothetical protein J6590_015972 [Homalodisca vitripennis]|nr:hypothetical protein J6590_015972 [Homalodisca vitripennis]
MKPTRNRWRCYSLCNVQPPSPGNCLVESSECVKDSTLTNNSFGIDLSAWGALHHQTPTDDNQDLFPPMGFRCSRREAITGTSLASQSRDFHSVPLACSVYSTACYARTNLFPGFAASVGTQLL